MSSVFRLCLAASAVLCAACIPPKLHAPDGAAGASGTDAAADTAGPADVAAETKTDAPAAETKPDAPAAETGGVLTLRIAADEDDAVWVDGTDERLHYGDTDTTIEVGTDGDNGRLGLRFPVDVPAGAHIVSASLRLRQFNGAFPTDSVSIAIQVYDSVNVAAFDDAHDHLPENHDPRHLWGSTVTGFMTANDGDSITSPDISKLLQRIVEKSDWAPGGHIGFVLSPDQNNFPTSSWVSFDDFSSQGDPATLSVTYASP